MSAYGWIIDTDRDPDLRYNPGTNMNAKGLMGPSGISQEHVDLLRLGDGIKFHLFDDDGNLMYEGRFLGDSESEDGFGPLDDFGTPNAGCTYIKYLRLNGEWEQL